MMESPLHVAIIGGGASGVSSAIQILRRNASLVIHLFNEGREIGRGVAYTASCDDLVLNVPAGRMSVFPDQPDHFVAWLGERFGARYTTASFVPRRIYGDYLRATLATARHDASQSSLKIHPWHVDELRPKNDGYLIVGGETTLFADAVILALGNLPPANPALGDGSFASDPRYVSNPCQEADKLHRIGGSAGVVILGSGLTAVDTILQLRQQGHRGKIDLISRRGQWPAVHRSFPVLDSYVPPQLTGLDPATAIKVLREKADEVEAAGGNWRQVVESVRPVTNAIWAAWTPRQRASFLRHLRPYWDIHRHRLASEVWSTLEREIGEGTLQLSAGRVIAIHPEKDAFTIQFRLRRDQKLNQLRADFVINCTGPEALRRQCCQPLVRSLLDQNLAELDPLSLGLATLPNGNLLNAEGRPAHRLFALGPVRRGSLWETTAMPEIRSQAVAVAEEVIRCLEQRPEPAAT
jgi:uncharacterized NAD(P)/FAD-binding protein YdhS